MACIVFTEYQIFQSAFFIYDGQLVDLVVPDDVVCFFQGCAGGSCDQVSQRCHEVFYLFCTFHTAHTVVSACNQTYQFALCCTICCNSYCGMTCSCFQSQNIIQCAFRADIGIGYHEACFVGFCSCYHCSLAFDGLRTINERDTAFLRQSHCHFVIGYRLHNRGYQRDVHFQSGFFAFFEFDYGCFQAYIVHHAILCGIAGNKQEFAESSGWFCKESCHFDSPPISRF